MGCMNTQLSAPVKSPAVLPSYRLCKYAACHRRFKPNRVDHAFCSKECRYAYHNFGSAFGTLTKQGLERLVKMASAELKAKLAKLAPSHVRELERKVAGLAGQVDKCRSVIETHAEAMRKQHAAIDLLAKNLEPLSLFVGRGNLDDATSAVALDARQRVMDARRLTAQAVSMLTAPGR